MPILRDIVARLGMDYDGTGFKKAEGDIDGITGGLNTMAIAAAGVAAAIGTIKLVEMGSDAQETMNVLNTSFGENTETVKEWADTFSQAAGRSEFEMREMAGTLGAVLNPLMGRNREVAAEMSTTLAQLAVDLGSFYNLADDDVLNKLRSGITGEAEPLKRLGVVMTEATLAEFARTQGINKNIKAMTIAEKTALRYQFILEQTRDAQGDAAKTADGWANATKGLLGGLKDLGTNIGLTLLPMGEKVVGWLSGLTRGFSRLVKETNIVQAAMIVLGGIAAALAVKLLIAFAPMILKFILIGAAIAAAALIVEDFISFLQGKKSVIGEFINMIAGPGSAEEAAWFLREAWAGLKLFATEQLFPSLQNLGNAFGWLKDDIVDWAKETWNSIKEYIQPGIDIIKTLTGWLLAAGDAVADFLGIDTDKLKKNFEDLMPTGADVATTVLTGLPGLAIKKGLENLEWGAYGSSFVGAEETGRSQFMRENAAAIRANPMLALSAGAQGRQVINQMSQELKINVEGLSDEKAARKIARAAAKETKKENRKALRALTQKSEV